MKINSENWVTVYLARQAISVFLRVTTDTFIWRGEHTVFSNP